MSHFPDTNNLFYFISDTGKEVLRVTFSKIACYVYGAGDLFSGLWIGWSARHPGNMKVWRHRFTSLTLTAIRGLLRL